MQGITRIRKNIYARLFSSIPTVYEQPYRKHCLEQNLQRMMMVAVVCVLAQIVTVAFHLFIGKAFAHQDGFIWGAILSSAYGVLMLCFLVTHSSQERKLSMHPAVPHVFWTVFLLLEAAMHFIEINLYGAGFRAYASIMFLALTPLFSRKILFLYIGAFSCAVAAILVLFGRSGEYAPNHYFYWGAYSLASLLLAALSVSINARHYATQQRLASRERELADMSGHLGELNEALEQMSTTDPLTRIANRRAFDDYFDRMWQQCSLRGEPIALMMIDIDHFSAFNSRNGHQEGDRCLQKIASALQARLNSTAAMLARYGGEEFVLLYPFADDEEVLLHTAETLRMAVELLKIGNPDSTNNPYVTVSVGIASRIPGHGAARPDVLIRLAMRALAQAKEQGRNRAVADIDADRGAFVAPRESLVQAPGSGEDLLKLRTILTSTTMATFAIDLATGAIEFSPETLDAFALPTLLFKSVREAVEALVYEPDRTAACRDFERMVERAEEDIPCVFRARTGDGAIRWVSVTSRHIPGKEGAHGEAVGSLMDVTLRMREQELTKLMADGASNYLFHLDIINLSAWFNDRFLIALALDPLRPHQSFIEALLPEDRAKILGDLDDVRAGIINTLDTEVRARGPGGQIVNLHCRGLASQDESGQAKMLAGTISDITEQVKARTVNRLIIDGSADCVFVYDIRQNTLEFSQKIMSITALPSLRFGNAVRVFCEAVVPEDRDRFVASLDPILSAQTDEYAIELRLSGKNGRPIWVALRAKATINENNEPTLMAGSLFNIEAMGQYNRYLEQQSLTDRVTHLPNRISFYREINRQARPGAQTGFIVMLDIDDFKSINSLHGHTTGDETLKRFGDLIMTEMPADGALYHLGADLFIVNLMGVDERGALDWMDRMKSADANFTIDGVEIFLNFSMGAVEYHEQQTADELLSDAEIALHRAKYSESEDFVVFTPGDREDYLRRAELENQLRRAADNAFEGFELYYQPLIDAQTGRCVGAEALLRWCTPDGEVVPPNETIPCLEATGLMARVETWVLHTAAEQCRKWIDAGASSRFIMNINLTPAQITQRTLIDEIAALLHQYRLRSENLALEITEASCVLDMQGGVHILKDMRDQGIGIAIDDFGTGYSSLSYLRHLPVSEIKIDRSFVRAIESDDASRAFMASIIQLSRNIGHVVCVEGIETEEQRCILRDMGADLFQGYYFSHPLPYDAFEGKYIDAKPNVPSI